MFYVVSALLALYNGYNGGRTGGYEKRGKGAEGQENTEWEREGAGRRIRNERERERGQEDTE